MLYSAAMLDATGPESVQALLDPDEPPPFEMINPSGGAKVVLLCDHASRAIPRRLGGLGLPEASLRDHIAWDVGSADLTRCLADLLDAPAVLAGYSRLVIDCNREIDDPSSIARESDGVTVPGNLDVDATVAARRAAACFWPYHRAAERVIEGFIRRGLTPVVIAVHTFTPEMGGVKRPWHVGVLWHRDERLARPVLDALSADPSICVGDNQPYRGSFPAGYSIPNHAAIRGLPNLQLEVRQDLVETREGAASWAGILARALEGPLGDPGLYNVVEI